MVTKAREETKTSHPLLGETTDDTSVGGQQERKPRYPLTTAFKRLHIKTKDRMRKNVNIIV